MRNSKYEIIFTLLIMQKEKNEEDTQLQQHRQSPSRLLDSSQDLQLPLQINSMMPRSNSVGRHKSHLPKDPKEHYFVERSKSTFQQVQNHHSENVVHIPHSSTQDFMEIQVNLFSKNGMQDTNKNKQHQQRKSMFSESKLSRGISIIDDEHEFLQDIKFSSIQRWALLIVSAICNAIVPCWMTVDIQCQGITRSAWRIFTLSILLLPFVFHQQKNNKKVEDQFQNLLKRDYLQKMYIGSINYCVWVLFGVLATKITSRAHSFCFLRLKFFIVTLKKISLKQECHQGEIGGFFLVVIGLIMMVWDSFTLPTEVVPDTYYLQCQWWQRLFGDLLAIIGCLVLIYLQGRYSLPKGPRFTNLFIYNVFISVNLVTFGYFFGGNEFTLDPKFGVFGLFTSQNFVGVFYVSIMLGLNLIIANVLVNQIFSQFIRNVASCFEIVITISVYHIFEIQKIYSGLTSLGLCFLVPGMMLIAGGQGTLQKLEIRINDQIYKTQFKSSLKRRNTFILKPISRIDLQSSKQLSPIKQNLSKQQTDHKSQKEKMQ